jgi:hypothetical protein
MPTQTPQPSPVPTEVPEKPFDSIPIVRELRAEGFNVEVNMRAINDSSRGRLPGEPSAREKLELFWKELAANKEELMARQAFITDLQITIYANYRVIQTSEATETKTLYLDFETPQNQLVTYFPLFDQLLRSSKDYGFSLSFIQSSNKRNEYYFQPLKTVLQGLAKHRDSLLALRGMIKSIEINSHSRYSEYSRELTLNGDRFESELQKFIGWLIRLAPVYQWADKNGVEFNAQYDLEANYQKVVSAFELLKTNLPSLQTLVQNRNLVKLSIFFTGYEQRYWDSLGSLTLCIDNDNKNRITSLLSALARFSQRAQEIGATIGLDRGDLNEAFLSSLKLLEKLWIPIKKKGAKIKKLSLSLKSAYWHYSEELVVGYESSEAETEKIISSIE